MRKKIIGMIIFITTTLFSSDYTLNDLIELKKNNLITDEVYEALSSEITGGNNGKGLYNLKVNGNRVSTLYSVIEKDGNLYLNLNEFFSLIKLVNYKKTDDKLELYLGENLEKIVLNLKNNEIWKGGERLNIQEKEWYIVEDDEMYLSRAVFTELFLNFLDIDTKNLEMNMYLTFSTPDEIQELLVLNEEKLNKKNSINELIYKDQKRLFDLGYTRVKLNQNFSKIGGERKYKKDWEGTLEYQGGLLYGELFFDYDIRENDLGEVRLNYADIWKNHSFDIKNIGSSKKREWSLNFYKDKGFYNFGNKIVIKEKVPIGSRAELIYMGTPIAIENEENGEVVFSNDMIKSDRDYELKIYKPDGKIEIKEIKTIEDYDKQNKNEAEYRLSVDERDNRYVSSSYVLYGVTDRLTLGGGLTRDIIDTPKGEKYYDEGKLSLIYGGIYGGVSYNFKLDSEKVFTDNIDIDDKNLKDKKKYEALVELRYDKYKFFTSRETKGRYYDEKEINKYEIKYDFLRNTSLEYGFEEIYKHRNLKREKRNLVGVNNNFSYKKFLIGTDFKLNLNDSMDNEYTVNTYYNGWKNMTMKFENKWMKSGKEYESAITLYNNNFKGFLDFSTEFRYSKERKDMLTFKFTVNVADWFTFETNADKTGNRDFKFGVDKTIDLKKPNEKIDNLDVSRVNVKTFIDDNNNNIYDIGEKTIDGVDVEIGNKKITTDSNGDGTFYGISNGILHNLKVKIKKPSYSLGNNEVKMLSKSTSTVDVYIPIKPMINLNGKINIAETLKVPKEKIEEFYSNVLVDIKNLDGETIELAAPDDTGVFDISGLFPEEYIIEVSYLGTDYKIEPLRERMKLNYNHNNLTLGFEERIVLNVKDMKIRLSKL